MKCPVIKKISKPRKLIPLSRKITALISVILTFIILTIILITDSSLNSLYTIQSAFQSLFAYYEIENAYSDPSADFMYELDNIERNYSISVEIFTSGGDFVYSSSYKGAQSAPPYNNDSIIIPDSVRKNYVISKDLFDVSDNVFSIYRDPNSAKNTEYLVGTWHTQSGITIKIFSTKTILDHNAKLTARFIAFVTIFVSFFGYIAITLVIRRQMKPINEMSEVTKNMSALDFSNRCEAGTTKEIALLADSINEMSVSLETALTDLRQKNEKLKDDIEKEKTIDSLRKTFISGVSHELKTPIAIIQGYSEGLKVFLESDPETARQYCDTIIDETERMNHLVMKLLDIIRYESGEYSIQNEIFNIYDVVENHFERAGDLLTESGITIINDIDKNFTGYGDIFILTTVISNYVSNAFAHLEGEKIIKASAKETDDGCYRISIFNTGKPIAPKDIDHIWTSFYRADKAMSRAQGRYGLGLAVVAAIQKLHGREYGAVNHDDGVEFWFDVKKKTQ